MVCLGSSISKSGPCLEHKISHAKFYWTGGIRRQFYLKSPHPTRLWLREILSWRSATSQWTPQLKIWAVQIKHPPSVWAIPKFYLIRSWPHHKIDHVIKECGCQMVNLMAGSPTPIGVRSGDNPYVGRAYIWAAQIFNWSAHYGVPLQLKISPRQPHRIWTHYLK